MGAIPERYLRIALIAASVYFIIMGLFSVAYNAPEVSASSTASKDEEDQGVRADAIAAIIVGCMEAVFGIYGLIAVMLKKRLLLIIFAGILSVAAIANIVVMIWAIIDHRQTKKENLKNAKDNMIRLYGNRTDDASLEFTMRVNTHQRMESCCGWSNDPSDNIYLKTPFYKEENKYAVKNDHKTLPEACCTKVSSACYKTKNLKKAREDSLVYELDCLEKMVGKATVYLIVTLIKTSFVAIVQIIIITITVLHVLQIV